MNNDPSAKKPDSKSGPRTKSLKPAVTHVTHYAEKTKSGVYIDLSVNQNKYGKKIWRIIE